MAFVPNILNYKPFYVQTPSDNSAIDTRVWGLVVKANPYPFLPKTKSIYKNDWKDENGDDEYLGEINYESFILPVTFYMKTYSQNEESSLIVLRRQMRSFFDKIKSGDFLIYDSYTGLGFQKVRYESFDKENVQFKSGDKWSRIIFTIKLKINDPVTEITIGTDGILKSD